MQLVGEVPDQRDVAAAPITFGAMPPHQPDVFQHMQVVREQVRAHPQPLSQFAGRGFPPGEGVHDRQAAGIAEGGVHCRSAPQTFVHLKFH